MGFAYAGSSFSAQSPQETLHLLQDLQIRFGKHCFASRRGDVSGTPQITAGPRKVSRHMTGGTSRHL